MIFSVSTLFSQRKKKIKGKQINITTSINYNSFTESYEWNYDNKRPKEEFDLTFVTRDSGTFLVVVDTIETRADIELEYPPRYLKFGIGLEIINAKSIYHKISIPQISWNRSKQSTLIQVRDEDNLGYDLKYGSELKTFTLALRYEIGKFTGDLLNNKLKFNAGMFLEAYYLKYYFQHDRQFPFKGQRVNLNLGLNTGFSKRVNKNVFIALNIAPYVKLTHIGSIRNRNPNIDLRNSEGTSQNEKGKLDFIASISCKLNLKDFFRARSRRAQ